MKHYKLTIENGHAINFWASHSQLKARLNTAYILFRHQNGLQNALLYVHHSTHGWCQVCYPDNAYPIINNPLALDNQKLTMAVNHTLAQADTFLTDEQKQQRKTQALQRERNMNTQISRGRFHIVKNSGNHSLF